MTKTKGSKKYNFNLKKTVPLPNGVQELDFIVTSTRDNREIEKDEVVDILKRFKKIAKLNGDRVDICIRGLIDKWRTFKTFDEDDVNIYDFDEYFDNQVRDSSKFNKISQLQVIVKKYKK
jgi:hypothetical protein